MALHMLPDLSATNTIEVSYGMLLSLDSSVPENLPWTRSNPGSVINTEHDVGYNTLSSSQ